MLLTWSKNRDGSPRAKAWLIVRGYNVDALTGQLETSSPTTTRLSKYADLPGIDPGLEAVDL